MKSLVSTVLVALSLLSLIAVPGCDSGEDVPSRQDLFGIWQNDDAGTTRAFEFAASDEDPALSGTPLVYTLYFYPTGSAPVVAQRGHYRIDDGHLVTEVVQAPVDPSLAGTSFANIIEGFSTKALTLESTTSASGTRVFAKATAL